MRKIIAAIVPKKNADAPMNHNNMKTRTALAKLDGDTELEELHQILVRELRNRARFDQNFTLGLLESGACVGWHWFKYMDNDPGDLTTCHWRHLPR